MKPLSAIRLLFFVVLVIASAFAQEPKAAKPEKDTAYFFDPHVFDASLLLEAPPTAESASTRADLAELHALEQSRTPSQVAAAQADDAEEDIFSFRNVLGDRFVAANLPITAAFSTHVHNDEGAASLPLKALMHRPRPYQADPTLHPVCKLSSAPNSYPSGHSLSGYLEAYSLIQMVPEKQAEIMARAEDYAHNRLVCGVHYRTDTEASKRVALAVFGYLLATPRYQKELGAATAETRRLLGLPALAPPR